MTLSELVRKIRDRHDVSDHLFTRRFILENSAYDSWEEKLFSVWFINLKGRINNLGKGYEPYTSAEFHTDHLAADDWVFVEVDRKAQTIKVKPKNRSPSLGDADPGAGGEKRR